MLVVGLTFLNFGHTSAVFAAGGRVVVTATSVCGDPLSTSIGDHFACHACRATSAIVPPAPAGVLPVIFSHTALDYAELTVNATISTHALAAQPRGPPRPV